MSADHETPHHITSLFSCNYVPLNPKYRSGTLFSNILSQCPE